MRMAWLHSHLLLWSGGARFIYEVSRRIHRTIPVDILVEQSSPKIRQLFEAEGMRVIPINRKSSTSLWYWLLFPYYLAQNIRYLRQCKSHYSFILASIFPMHYAAYRADIKPYSAYVLEPFAFFHDHDMIRGFPFWKRIPLWILSCLYKKLDVAGVRKASSVMTINSGTAAWTKEIYGCDAVSSYLGVDTTLFAPKDKPALTEKYRGRKIVIHSTDFTPLKRTWDAVKAIESCRHEVPEVKLLITQSSENRDEIDKLNRYIAQKGLGDHVELVGYLSHEDLPFYYSLADISLYTGIGRGASAASLFVLECMACETPGIRTRFTEDEIIHDVSGFLYTPGNTRQLQEYLIRLLRDDDMRKRFGKAGREKVVRDYSWDAVSNRFLTFIENKKKSTVLKISL